MERDTMEQRIREFVEQPVWAVVGYSENRRKYGHLILHDLRSSGYVVFPVNRRGGEMDGMKVYPSVGELPIAPGVVNIVIPPEQTLQVVRECRAAGLLRVWMQPGAESEEAIEYCRENAIQAVYHACAMVEKSLMGRGPRRSGGQIPG